MTCLIVLFAIQTASAQTCGPNDPPIVVDIDVDDSYCEGEEIMLSTNPAQGAGDFSTALGGIINNGDGTGVFNPVLSGGTATFTIQYNYVDAVSGCTFVGSSSVEVFETPEGSLSGIPVPGIDPQVCIGDVVEIAASPIGGSFATQAGLVDNGDGTATFTAPLSGAVAVYDINYMFTDPITGCDGSAAGSILVFDCGPDCEIDAGVLSGNAFVCADEFVIAGAIGTIGIDAGSGCTLNYVLHDGISPSTGTTYGSSTNGVFTNDGSYPTNQQLCITAVASCPDGCYDESNCLPVVFMQPIDINTSQFCDPNTGITTVTFSVTGGGPGYLPGVHTYDIGGSYTNPTATPNTTYSFTVAAGAPFSIVITDDGKGCSATFNGVADVCQVTCTNNAGSMSQALQTACQGEFVNAPTTGATVQAGSVLTYIIHSGQFTLGTVYGTSATGVFTNVGGIPTNINLYISAVVAPLDANGQPNLSDACSAIALPGTPVRFYDPIAIASDYVCNETTGEYTVTFSISGGGPSFPGSDHFYTVSGVYNGLVEVGVTYTTSPISDGDFYTIIVSDDGKGCNESATFGPIECAKLPIELVSYEGEVQTEGNYLKWITATEINNDYFTLESSTDLTNFEYLATIAGSGNTNVDQSYDYLDRNAPSGTSYYKLSQTDYDGTTVVVGIVELTRGEYQFDITNIAPNPVMDVINVFISSNVQANVQISVVNALGQVLIAQDINLDFDITQHTLDLVDLATGVYVLQIVNNDYVVNKKFMKN